MVFDLGALLTDPSSSRRESSVAFFLTPTPWVGSAAYLHILYKPAPQPLLREVSERLLFPSEFLDLLGRNNGAILFSGSLAVYGVVKAGQTLNRSDPYGLPPYNIEPENDSWTIAPKRLLVVGGYGEDGSRVCLDRRDSGVLVYPRSGSQPIASFASLAEWLGHEVERYRGLYDRQGRLLRAREETGPPRHHSGLRVN